MRNGHKRERVCMPKGVKEVKAGRCSALLLLFTNELRVGLAAENQEEKVVWVWIN